MRHSLRLRARLAPTRDNSLSLAISRRTWCSQNDMPMGYRWLSLSIFSNLAIIRGTRYLQNGMPMSYQWLTWQQKARTAIFRKLRDLTRIVISKGKCRHLVLKRESRRNTLSNNL